MATTHYTKHNALAPEYSCNRTSDWVSHHHNLICTRLDFWGCHPSISTGCLKQCCTSVSSRLELKAKKKGTWAIEHKWHIYLKHDAYLFKTAFLLDIFQGRAGNCAQMCHSFKWVNMYFLGFFKKATSIVSADKKHSKAIICPSAETKPTITRNLCL